MTPRDTAPEAPRRPRRPPPPPPRRNSASPPQEPGGPLRPGSLTHSGSEKASLKALGATKPEARRGGRYLGPRPGPRRFRPIVSPLVKMAAAWPSPAPSLPPGDPRYWLPPGAPLADWVVRKALLLGCRGSPQQLPGGAGRWAGRGRGLVTFPGPVSEEVRWVAGGPMGFGPTGAGRAGRGAGGSANLTITRSLRAPQDAGRSVPALSHLSANWEVVLMDGQKDGRRAAVNGG